MDRKQGKADEVASAELIVWTNVSQNPVILGDGSTVAPGETTTPEQAEFAEGSFWEEHGVLISGVPLVVSAESQQFGILRADNEDLRNQLVEAGTTISNQGATLAKFQTQLQEQAETLGTLRKDLLGEQANSQAKEAELEALRKSLAGEQEKAQKLEVDLKAAQAKK